MGTLGYGCASEAIEARFAFCLKELGLRRVSDTVDPADRASVRVLEKLGLRCEARHCESQWIKRQWRDGLVYAIPELSGGSSGEAQRDSESPKLNGVDVCSAPRRHS